jgi:hypothetical protein
LFVIAVVLKRLDDVSDDVRRASVTTLVKLFKPLPADYCMEVSSGHVDVLLSSMLIHLDDPEPGFQHIMLGTLSSTTFIILTDWADVQDQLILEPVTMPPKLSQTTPECVRNITVDFLVCVIVKGKIIHVHNELSTSFEDLLGGGGV